MGELNKEANKAATFELDLDKKAIYLDPDGKRVRLNPKVQFNYKWFRGEFHTAPWGADASPYAGESIDGVRVAMPGKKLDVTVRNGESSVWGTITAVVNQEDRRYIGQSGWWRTESIGRGSTSRRKRI